MSNRATWMPVRPAETLRWPTPITVGGPSIDLLRYLPDRFPELGVLQVHDAQVLGLHGWITANDRVQHDYSWFGSAFEEEVGDQWPPDLATVHLPGVTVSLVSEWANVNYCHLMYDSIPRLDLFERSGFRDEQVDRYLCPTPVRGIPLWTELGLDPSRILFADPRVTYEVDTLLAPSFPGARFALPRWAVGFLRDRLSVAAAGQRRRLYIPRTTTRFITNEADVWAVLAANGFERFDPAAEDVDGRDAFAAADIIVSAHGAAFANMVFCPPTATIFELIPTDHAYPYFFAAAAACGLHHCYLAGESEGLRQTAGLQASVYNFSVDTDQLARAIRQLTNQ